MKVLVLGGIGESKAITRQLIDQGHEIIYSIVGLVRQPEIDCEVHLGGFSNQQQTGAEGLGSYCRQRAIDLLVDATHPYAQAISANAVVAAGLAGIECWRYLRPGWQANGDENWHEFESWDELIPRIVEFAHPLFTTGASIVAQLDQRPPDQQWIIRSATEIPDLDGLVSIKAIGPFTYEDELALMRQYNVDVLISKNSGGHRLADKLRAADDLNIPVFMQWRPELATANQCYDQVKDLLADIAKINTSGN